MKAPSERAPRGKNAGGVLEFSSTPPRLKVVPEFAAVLDKNSLITL